LGKGLGALIPPLAKAGAIGRGDGAEAGAGGGKSTRRPVDLLFTSSAAGQRDWATEATPVGEGAASPGSTAGSGAAAPGGRADRDAEPVAAELVAVPGAEFAMVPIGAIRPNSRQPRQEFDQDALRELADSIKEVGLLQPVVLRPNAAASAGSPSPGAVATDAVASGSDAAAGADGFGSAAAGDVGGWSADSPDGGVEYELVMGERRWRASQLAGLTEVPAIIRGAQDSDMLRDALLENLHRSQLNPLEEAAAYRQLMDDFSCTQEELAVKVSRSRPQISNTLRLLKLPPLVQRRLAAGVISAGHARALLSLQDGAAIERMAQKIVAEGLSVRGTEELVSLGEVPADAKPKRATVRAGSQHRALDDLQDRLADRFDTKVSVSLGKAKGRIVIEFASVADLNRIIQVLDPEDPGVLK
jgi:ParB family chromosome partitioning protein